DGARIHTANVRGAITESTLAETRAFVSNGFSDITYSVPIEPGKFNAAIDLAKRCRKFCLLTDDPAIPLLLNDSARCAEVTLDLLLKVDCGYHRCGVKPDSIAALEIPRQISGASNLRFAGILTHTGHSYHCRSKDQRLAVAR